MNGKKIAAIIAAAVVVIAAAVVWILWPSHPYAYKVTLTDSSGQEISDLTALSEGDTVYMSVEIQKKGKDTVIEAYGLEFTSTLTGLTYNGDGEAFSDKVDISAKKQNVAQTETISFMFIDMDRNTISMENPQTVGTCSFTVTDPANAKLDMSVALIYTADHTDGYEVIQGK